MFANQSGNSRARRHGAASVLLACALLAAGGTALAGASPQRHVIVIEAMRYSPETLEVKAGDTVVWENKDAFPHTATASDHSFDSGEIPTGRTWKFRPARKGTFTYVCTLHPTMKATLIVK